MLLEPPIEIPLMVSENVIPVQFVPPIVSNPAASVSIEFVLSPSAIVTGPSMAVTLVEAPRSTPIVAPSASFADVLSTDGAVMLPVKVVAPMLSEKVTPVQLAPPMVSSPAVVVSIELAVSAPHFIVPVKMLMFEDALPFSVSVRPAAPMFSAPFELAPLATLTTVDDDTPVARFNHPAAVAPLCNDMVCVAEAPVPIFIAPDLVETFEAMFKFPVVWLTEKFVRPVVHCPE